MHPVTLVLIVHDHQPIGNFDGVFERAYQDAYDPFLRFLEAHPGLRLALHTSGPLLQWIALHRPDYLDRLRPLVDRGQVELWGGGFFEPVLTAISEPDRRGQIHAMSEWLELELGQRPRGLWLAERVWEPGLASSLGAAGVEYTAVDDAHFVAAGFERDDLWGYFSTEDQGQAVHVFPIHRELRYFVPFEAPERTIDLMRRVAQGGPGRIAVLGDDGEKFGIWPGTHALCYEDRWLERWVDVLAANPWIELRTPAEAVAHHASRGLAYLPTASYHEMQEWALPPAAQRRYHQAAERLAAEFGEGAHDLLRGGHWRSFLARYPESNRLHKRAARASRLLWDRTAEADPAWREARMRLWRAQCNCPYWHGVFGGLYLPHLREALYRELIAAEAYLAPPEPRRTRSDVDLDGYEDALIETPTVAAWISGLGGRLWALDDRRACTNLVDTLARRREAYHEKMVGAAVGGGEGASIHEGIRVKEEGLAALAGEIDSRGRDACIDAWREDGLDHDWALERFALENGDGATIVARAPAGPAPALVKRFTIAGEGAIDVAYELAATGPRAGTLAVDLNLGVHVPCADDRVVEVDGIRADPPHFAGRATHRDVRRVAFVDRWAGRRITITTDRPAQLSRAPIETVSMSEAGAERILQGVEARLEFPVSLAADAPWRNVVRIAAGPA